MKISEQLQKQRKQHNMSQEQLADKLSISRQAISKWENGTTLPSFSNVVMISELFDISLDDIIKGDEQLMNKFEDDDKIKFSAVEIIIWLGIVLGAIAFGLLKFSGVSDKLINYWISVPEIICFIGILFNIKWKYLNKSLNRTSIILATILVALLLIPELASILQGIKSGLDEGTKMGMYLWFN